MSEGYEWQIREEKRRQDEEARLKKIERKRQQNIGGYQVTH